MRKTLNNNFRQVLAMGLACVMTVAGGFSGNVDYVTDESDNKGRVFAGEIGDSELSVSTAEAVRIASLHNPVSDEINETVDFSYVYFGSFPQDEVTGEALTTEIINGNYGEKSNDANVGNEKYHRKQMEDGTYRYFKFEPIRWRVICKNGNEAILRSDLVLNCMVYNSYIYYQPEPWVYSDVRYWLNNYASETSFIKKAFTKGELNAINAKYQEEDFERDTNSRDKVYMLSGAELSKLGGLDKSFELVSKASEYAMSSNLRYDCETGNACWWVRNNGEYEMNGYAGYVNEEGIRFNAIEGAYNTERPAVLQTTDNIGVCPVIVLNLENTDVWCTEDEKQNGFVIDRREEDAYVEYGRLGTNVYYQLIDNVMYVRGSGAMYNYDYDAQDKFSIDSVIKKIVIEDGITSIGKCVFLGLDELEEVIIPDSVTSIGEAAFKVCDKLENITLPESITDFGYESFYSTKWYEDLCANNEFVIINGILTDMNNCKGEAIIPENVTYIRSGVLKKNSDQITKIVIPATVEKIDYSAFAKWDFQNDIKKFYVAEDSVAEEYFKNMYGSGYYVIKSDGTTELVSEATESPQNTEDTKPTENVAVSEEPVPSEIVKTSEVPVFSESVTISEQPMTSDEAITSMEPEESMQPEISGAAVLGDVNQDKKIDLSDAQLVLKVALKIETLIEGAKLIADVDKDDNVTLNDAQIILKAALKIISLNDEQNVSIKQVGIASKTVSEIAQIVKKQRAWEPFAGLIEDTEFTVPEDMYYSEEPMPLKPVIYLYPEETTEIEVELDFNGDFTFTWPDYRDGWKVIAEPDGKLTDTYDGSEHHYLFWEGKSNVQYTFNEGFCVKGEDTATFLKWALEEQGLIPKEYNDFITFWVPRMQENEYNVISFVEDIYTDNAKLSFSQEPNTMKRVFMAWYGSDEEVVIEEQELTGFERTGFTVVEWGGAEVPESSYKK